MALQDGIATRSVDVASGTSIEKNRFVTVGASGAAYPLAGAHAVGVTLNRSVTPASTNTAAFKTTVLSVAMRNGARVEVRAGEDGIAIGDSISSDTDGKAVETSGNAQILGFAETAGDDDDLILITLL